jgi:hypothetical protein
MVSTHGPIALQKSLPLDGPMVMPISNIWMSRALTSLKIVTPAIRPAACFGVRSTPPPEMKKPSSKSSCSVKDGHSRGSPGPVTASLETS